MKWVDLTFDSLLWSIEAGDIEAIAASIAPTEERAKSVDFSDVYYSGSQSLVYGIMMRNILIFQT
ncbi:MAG: transporter substrate-binding domain-containing protein [Mediterraneibacter gnavus]